MYRHVRASGHKLHFTRPHYLSLIWVTVHRGPPVHRDFTVHGKILNLISGLDSDEELGLLGHHASYLGDCRAIVAPESL